MLYKTYDKFSTETFAINFVSETFRCEIFYNMLRLEQSVETSVSFCGRSPGRKISRHTDRISLPDECVV